MQIDNSTAIVDKDFINHLASSRKADYLLVCTLLDIFNSLSVAAAIHPLVYDKELFPQTDRIKLLFQKEVIRRLTFDDAFVVHDIKIIEGQEKLFTAMPSRRTPENEFKDIAHPINSEMRELLEKAIISKYEEVVAAEE